MKITSVCIALALSILAGCTNQDSTDDVQEGALTQAVAARQLTKGQLEGVDCVTSVEAERIISLDGSSRPSGNWLVMTDGGLSANACFSSILFKIPGAQLLGVIDDDHDFRLLTISSVRAVTETGTVTKAQLESVGECVSSAEPEMTISLGGGPSVPTGNWLVTTTAEFSAGACFSTIRSKVRGAQLLGVIDFVQGTSILHVAGKKRQ